MRIEKGNLIRISTYGGKVVSRRVVEVGEQAVILTTDEECQAAAKEKREPVRIGFPLADVIEAVEREH